MDKETTQKAGNETSIVRETGAAYLSGGNARVFPTDFMCDTDLETQRKYYSMLKALPVEKRMMRALKLSQFVRAAAIEAIKRQNPDFDWPDVRREYLRRILPSKQFLTYFPEVH